MAAYEYTGTQDAMYPWGVVHPGEIAYFTGRAPNGDWTEVVPSIGGAPIRELPPEPEEPPEELKRPNKAASAAAWSDYAKAEGSFPGDPETATRQAIIDHYYGGDQ